MLYAVRDLFYGVRHETSPAQAPAPSLTGRYPKRWLILGVICLAQLTVLLDNTVLNVAIPSLTRELGATTADVQWMINAYSLVQSGLLLTAGNAADRYGRKKMLATGLVLFGLASLVAGPRPTPPGQLIAARAGMGVGGALLVTTTLAVVMQIFDDAERPKAIGIWSHGQLPRVRRRAADRRRRCWTTSGGARCSWSISRSPLMAWSPSSPWSRSPGARGGEPPDLPGALLSTIGMAGVVFAIISGPAARLAVAAGP